MKQTAITIAKFILFFFGWAIFVGVLPLIEFMQPSVWRLWAEFMPFLAMLIFTLLFWFMDRKTIRLACFNNPLKSILIAVVTGVLWIGSTVIVMKLMGVIRFEGRNEVPMLIVWILAVFLNVVMQELLVRGYLYQMIKQRHSIYAAAFVTTALFTVLHGGAFEAGIIPVLNVITMSLLMTVILEYTGSLIAPVIMHFIWNGVGAVILGGVNLAEDYPHLLNMVFEGNELLSGGSCKIEGSIVVLALNIILIAFFLYDVLIANIRESGMVKHGGSHE